MSDVVVRARVELDGLRNLEQQAAAAGQQIGESLGQGVNRSKSDLLRDLEQLRQGLDRTAGQSSATAKAGAELGQQFTRTGRELQTAANGLRYWIDDAGRARDATGRFLKAVELAEAGLEDLAQTTRGAGASINLLDGLIQGVAFSLTNTLVNAAQNAIGTVQGLVTGFMDLDGEIRKAAAAAGEDGAYERLGRVIDQVGIEAAGTTQEVAGMATSLARAGFSVKEIEQALPGVIRGAEATGTGFESMGSIAGNTLRGMGLETKETARVIDVLVNTANSSNASIEGLGYTMQYAAPIAKALGVSLEDLAAAAGLMANAGIDGSVAGTGLRTGLQRLQQAATGASGATMGLGHGQEKLAKSMRILGADITKQDGTLKSLDQVLISLKRNFERFDVPTKVSLSEAIFGEESGSKFLAALNQSETAIIKMFRDINNSSGATDDARTKMQGLGLETQQLTGTMDSLGKTVGGVAGTALWPLVKLMNGLLGVVAALPNPVKNLGAAVLLLGVAYTSTIVAAQGFALAVNMAGGREVVIASIRGLAAALSGPLVAGYRAATAAAVAFNVAGMLPVIATVGLVAAGITLLYGAVRGFNNAQRDLAAVTDLLGITQASDRAQEQLKGLDQQIQQVGKLIEDRRKFGLDTSAAESRLQRLERQAAALRATLAGPATSDELKAARVDAGKAIDSQEGATGSRAIAARTRLLAANFATYAQQGLMDGGAQALDARVRAYNAAVRQRERGIIGSAIAPTQDVVTLTDGAKAAGVAVREVREQIARLTEQRISLPMSAELDRSRITEQIADLNKQLRRREQAFNIQVELSLIPGGIKAAMDQAKAARGQDAKDQAYQEAQTLEVRRAELQVQLQQLAAGREIGQATARQLSQATAAIKLAEAQLGVEEAQLSVKRAQDEAGLLRLQRDGAISPAAAEAMRSELAISGLQEEIRLARERLTLLDQKPDLTAADADQQRAKLLAGIAQKEGEIFRTQTQAAQQRRTAERELQQQQQSTEEKRLEIARQENDLQQKRLSAQQQLGQSLLNLAQAQAELRQSQFGVEDARNNAAIRTAEQELEAARQRGASASELAGRERDLEQLRQNGKQLEQDRARTSFQDMLARQQVEGQILALKQQQTAAEQQSAVIAARRAELQAQGQAVQAQQALADAIARGASPQEIAALRESANLANTGVQLAQSQVRLEEDRLSRLGRILELERQIQATQQVTQRNQARTQLITVGAARFTGGPVAPGQSYVINDGPIGGPSLGQESFLSRGGALSLINRPAGSVWQPPAPGMVLPAAVTAQLKARGAFGVRSAQPAGQQHGGGTQAGVAVAGGPEFAQLAREMGNLRVEIARLARKNWQVRIPVASNPYANSMPSL